MQHRTLDHVAGELSPLDLLSRDGEIPVPGRSAYTRSKAAAETYVRELQERGVPVRITYPTAVVGPDDPALSEANHGLRALMEVTGIARVLTPTSRGPPWFSSSRRNCSR